MAEVVYLHAQPQQVVEFLRIGSNSHRQLEHLLAAGQLPLTRFVVDAGSFDQQKELIAGLKQAGREIVLDTNVAELSVIGRFRGTASKALWADPDSVLTEAHFRRGVNEFDVIGRIARFCVMQGVTRVLAPTHLLENAVDPWLTTDIASSELLRNALDIEGGKDIAIDYPLMILNATLTDAAQRRQLIQQIADTTCDSIWLRVSGFGAEATGVGICKYISAAQEFHVLGKPMIADGVGGLCGLAIAAFGATCGVTHGVAEKERFDTGSWHKPPTGGGGGGGYSVLLPGIDRLLKKEDAEALIAAPSGRRLLSCNNRACCPHGFEDTVKNPKAHYLRQRAAQYSTLSTVPDQRRISHFLTGEMAQADRTARQIAKLKLTSSELIKVVEKNTKRLERMRDVLENLEQTSTTATRSVAFPLPKGSGRVSRKGLQ
jgi:hypothetical protein